METTLIYSMDNLMSMNELRTNYVFWSQTLNLRSFWPIRFEPEACTQSNSRKEDLHGHLWTSVPAGEHRKTQ